MSIGAIAERTRAAENHMPAVTVARLRELRCQAAECGKKGDAQGRNEAMAGIAMLLGEYLEDTDTPNAVPAIHAILTGPC